MTRLAKVILMVLLVAIPLRGMAGVVAAFCEPAHHGAGEAVHAECDGCEHDGTHHEAPDEGSAAKCSHCAACSVSAPLVSESAHRLPLAAANAAPVSFLNRSLPGRIPGRLDRPPLSLVP